MKYRRSVIDEEALNLIQHGWAQLPEYAESETLSDRRVDTVEDGVCPRAFDPLGTAIRE
jgi:hypothetical protein